ncbi:MAG: N-succinyldiaminopimelate aminotransferase [Aliidongia sp.]|nr:N-succinyldiaminopimelate aminotransferase [Aliidongia sp.]
MAINERLDELGDNPFTRLNALLKDVVPRGNERPLILSVGEPQHAPPGWVAEIVAARAGDWNRYPPIQGSEEFRGAACNWLARRYGLAPGFVDPDRHLLALCGTKEGLYLAAELAVPAVKSGRRPAVLLPNPLYLTYRGAGVMAGAEIVPLPAGRATGFLPDLGAVDGDLLDRTALVFLCSPANPQGAIAGLDYLKHAIRLARRHDFVLIVDECYSEIYDRDPPPGALEAAQALGGGLDNLLVFHSLSKRSNGAGLRAGFVAGDERLIRRFFTLRSYGGSQMPLPIQAAAAALWRDEGHVVENRALYRAKIDIAERVLGTRFGFYRPAGGFFLWLDVGADDEAAALALWRECGVKAVPGSYLGTADAEGQNPGAGYLRLALVHDDETVADALERVVRIL